MNNPETLEDLLEAWPDVADVIQALRESPDLVMGKKNLRLKPSIVATEAIGMPEAAAVQLLPFEITVTEDTIKAAPGTLDGDTIAETTEASPASGTWYLEAKVTINATSGAVTATAVQWTLNTPSSSTTTDFYQVLGEVDVVGGVPDADSINQYDYGPLIVVQHGAVSDKWGVLIF